MILFKCHKQFKCCSAVSKNYVPVSFFCYTYVPLRAFTLANFLGFLALIAYFLTLTPGIFKTVFPKTRKNKTLLWLLKKRRGIGITSYVLACSHGLLLVIEKNINFLEFETYVYSFHGMLSFLIMSLLAITSNDWSVKLLKKKWSKIHQLTYLLVFILPWHILDKMSYSWDYLTPLAVLICFIFICLFIHRKILEWKKHLQAE